MKILLAVSATLIVIGAAIWHDGRVESDELLARTAILERVGAGKPSETGASETGPALSATNPSDRLEERVGDVKAQVALGMLAVATGLGVAGVAWTRRREQLQARANATSPDSSTESGLANRKSATTLS